MVGLDVLIGVAMQGLLEGLKSGYAANPDGAADVVKRDTAET